MTEIKAKLFEAFKEDHATLGRGFYDLAEALRSSDVSRAKQIAKNIDEKAGPHIAFEEQDFYPRLRRIIGDADCDAIYREHEKGLAAVKSVLEMQGGVRSDDPRSLALLNEIETMEEHIAECGSLFGAMGGIPQSELEGLYDQLLKWREARPSWTDYEKTVHGLKGVKTDTQGKSVTEH